MKEIVRPNSELSSIYNCDLGNLFLTLSNNSIYKNNSLLTEKHSLLNVLNSTIERNEEISKLVESKKVQIIEDRFNKRNYIKKIYKLEKEILDTFHNDLSEQELKIVNTIFKLLNERVNILQKTFNLYNNLS